MSESDFIKTTEEIEVPSRLIDQVIGQNEAVEIIKKAAHQRRHVMLIGSPGTGKSMLGKAMADLLPAEDTQDVLIFRNNEDSNNPHVRVVPAGKGQQIVAVHKKETKKKAARKNSLFALGAAGLLGYSLITGQLFMGIIAAAISLLAFRYLMPKSGMSVPKLLVSNADSKRSPYIEATGSHAGALLGDVRHDPFQSGGLETPPHERVEAGAIHKANHGVLFIDEINTLRPEMQQSLLTALQEGEYSITGQSDHSSGALVRTEPVPCNFVMIAAGNLDAIKGMHPALRSRIKGYGYEVYMRDSMKDTPENREALTRFVAQEVTSDGKIPHFDSEAVTEIIQVARRMSERKGQLTLRLRDLGGLIRAAGDLAAADESKYTTATHVRQAKNSARSVEQQIADQSVELRNAYSFYENKGAKVGRVNGLAVSGDTGMVLPILADVVPAQSKEEGKIIATGLLQKIAKESVQNVSALIKKYTGKNIAGMDVHIQFIGTYDGLEGDSASISIATAIVSALENLPIRQNLAMTGSLSIRGDVLPVGAVTSKIEAAAKAGMNTVLIPKDNYDANIIDSAYGIEVVPVSTVEEVFEKALIGKKDFLSRIAEIASFELDNRSIIACAV
ncbi:MAG: ATP-dependent protease LonB [Methanotrichaceae archaeon]